MLVHTDIRKYKCDKCNLSFKLKHTLKAHYVIHTGEIPYKCNICFNTFTRHSSLNYHRKTHTNTFRQRQKIKEQKIADFLDKNNIVYKREHRIDFGKCINSNDGKYCMLDFTFLTKDGRKIIVLECDEFQHNSYPISCEMRRMNDAYTSVLTDINNLDGIHWIRFNPDSFKINNKNRYFSIKDRYNKLKECIIDIQNNPPKDTFTILYLFYDIIDKKLNIFNDIDFPENYKKNTSYYPII